MITADVRQLSAYEQTHLSRFGFTHLPLPASSTTPVEYLTGKVEFCGHVFSVSPSVLIPRVETEKLVSMALSSAKTLAANSPHQALSIAEIGTGSGAIGISLHLELIQQQIAHHLVLSEISENALKVAANNLKKLTSENSRHSSTTCSLLHSNLFEKYPATSQFDLIVANLPYIPSTRIPKLDPSVTDHEPILALDGGTDGLEIILECVKKAGPHLKPHALLLLEVDDSHTQELLSNRIGNIPDNSFTITTYPDFFGKNRFAKIWIT